MAYAIDPELAPMVAALPETDFSDVAAARRTIDALVAPTLGSADVSGLRIDERLIPGPDGHEVPVRTYVPEERATERPAVLHIHGGGFAVGSVDSEHAGSAQVARELG